MAVGNCTNGNLEPQNNGNTISLTDYSLPSQNAGIAAISSALILYDTLILLSHPPLFQPPLLLLPIENAAIVNTTNVILTHDTVIRPEEKVHSSPWIDRQQIPPSTPSWITHILE